MQALLDDLRKQLDLSGAELVKVTAERDILSLKARKIRYGRKKILEAIVNLEEELAKSSEGGWVKNTGDVPKELQDHSLIEVEYSNGGTAIWDQRNTTPYLWTLECSEFDVVRWRFV